MEIKYEVPYNWNVDTTALPHPDPDKCLKIEPTPNFRDYKHPEKGEKGNKIVMRGDLCHKLSSKEFEEVCNSAYDLGLKIGIPVMVTLFHIDLKEEKEITIMTSKYLDDRPFYGIDGQYFKIPLSKELKYRDVICTDNKDILPLYITDEPIEHVVEKRQEGTCEYWVHTVVLYGNSRTNFFPRSFLLPGTIFKMLLKS